MVRGNRHNSQFFKTNKTLFQVPRDNPEESQCRVDFTMEKKKWCIEFLRGDSKLKSHIESLEKGGKYHNKDTKDCRVVSFVYDEADRPPAHWIKKYDNLIVLDFTEMKENEDERFVKWISKGKKERIEMQGKLDY